jgi:YD repeat-containing protein
MTCSKPYKSESFLNLAPPATMTVAGQPQVTYTYDNANRLTTITQSTSTVTIGYDDADRRTSVTYPNTNKVEYAYSAASELTTITYEQGTTTLGTLTYTYDAVGNRIKTGGTFITTEGTACRSANHARDRNSYSNPRRRKQINARRLRSSTSENT